MCQLSLSNEYQKKKRKKKKIYQKHLLVFFFVRFFICMWKVFLFFLFDNQVKTVWENYLFVIRSDTLSVDMLQTKRVVDLSSYTYLQVFLFVHNFFSWRCGFLSYTFSMLFNVEQNCQKTFEKHLTRFFLSYLSYMTFSSRQMRLWHAISTVSNLCPIFLIYIKSSRSWYYYTFLHLPTWSN